MSLLQNLCNYNKCGLLFETLSDLICHIEFEHIDFDQRVVEQFEDEKPDFLSMSYVHRYSNPNDPVPKPFTSQPKLKETSAVINIDGTDMLFFKTIGCDLTSTSKSLLLDKTIISGNRSADLRLNEEFNPEMWELMNHELFIVDTEHKKPIACNMPGCQKRYKNINGIKYHYKNFHKFNYPQIWNEAVAKYNKQMPFIAQFSSGKGAEYSILNYNNPRVIKNKYSSSTNKRKSAIMKGRYAPEEMEDRRNAFLYKDNILGATSFDQGNLGSGTEAVASPDVNKLNQIPFVSLQQLQVPQSSYYASPDFDSDSLEDLVVNNGVNSMLLSFDSNTKF